MRREELEQLQRYERLIADTVQCRGGLPGPRPFPAIVHESERQPRGEYRGLVVYSWATSAGASLSGTAFQAWVDVAARQIEAAPVLAGELHARDGQRITQTVWLAMAIHAAGEADLAARAVLEPLIASQQKHGPFLKPSAGDNLESLWYHELVLLHAVASYGVSRPHNRHVGDAVFRATEYHLNETQPDHATNDPWALFAFLWNPETRPLADGLLHAAATMGGGGGAVTLMLLADALYCLRRLISTTPNQDEL